MSSKKLFLLLALLGVLVVIAVLQKRPSGPANLADEAGLTALPTSALDADDIQGIDIAYGTHRQNALKLRRHDRGWVAANYYQAPVQRAKMNTLLRALTHLQGELRSDKAELLKNFQLESGQAYHLRIFTQSLSQAAVHLLVGKRKSTIGFVRLEDDTRVYSISSDLFSVLDLQPDQAGGPPDTKVWLDLQIQNIAEQAIESVALRTPQRFLQFSRSLPADSNKADSNGHKKEQAEWVLAHPVIDIPLRQSYVDGLISTLRTLRAEDITASDQLEVYGLTNPAYEATVLWRSETDGPQSSILSIGNEVPQQKDKRYARREHRGPVYILPAWSFKRLFPQPEQVLDWPKLDAQPDALRQITFSAPGRTLQFERENLTASQNGPATSPFPWRMTRPAINFGLQQAGFDKWVKRLMQFSPDDLAPESFKPDTAQQADGPTIDLVLENGAHDTLRLGPVIDKVERHYALFFNAFSTPFAITDATRQDIFPALKDILSLRPLATGPDDIRRLAWQIGPHHWRLERAQATDPAASHAPAGTWRRVDAEPANVDQHQVESALLQIVNITAEDWIETPEQAWHDAEHPLVIELGLSGNRTVELTLLKRNALRGLKYSDLPGLFILPEGTYTSLQTSLSALAVAPPALSAP